MANLRGAERAHYVQQMFERVAERYDLMNRIMTAGQDIRWRKAVIRRAAPPPGGLLLDLGAGTGDLGGEALEFEPTLHVIAADFTLEMMQAGKKRLSARERRAGMSGQGRDPASDGRLSWSGADAVCLPFPDRNFDAVVSAFLLRNVSDLPRCLAEGYRVLKPGGRIVALETTPLPRSPLAPLLRFHMQTVIPALGRLVAGQAEAYRYLPDSTEGFLKPEQLADRMIAAGFQEVGYERLMLGAVAIHWGKRG